MTTSPATPTPRKQPPPDLLTILECAFRHKWLALAAGCVMAALGATAGQLGIPAQYKATAMVRLSGPNGVVERPHESSNAQREFRSTQQELIKMQHVLLRALEMPQVRELDLLDVDTDSADDLASWITLELPRSSEILRISVRHNRADAAYILSNAVTEAYLQELRRDSEEDLEKRITVLDKLHATVEERLAKSWAELQVLARELGSGDPAALSLQAQAEIENYREYARKLRDLRGQKREAERIVKSIQETPDSLPNEMPEDASMNSVKFAMFQARLNRGRALAKWGPNHPDVKNAEHEESLLREYYQNSATENAEQPKSRQTEMLAEPLATIGRVSNEEAALEALMREIDDRIHVLGGDNTSKLEILRNDIDRMERLSDRLWQTRESLQVESHADQRVQLVSYANLPTQKDTSKRKKLTIVLAAAGFGAAFFLAALYELLTGRIHSQRDAGHRTGIEFLAALPKLPHSLPGQPGANEAELVECRTKFDMLVAQLTHHPAAHSPRAILVSSAKSKRERLNLATHLAAGFARTGKKTLLIDLDLRQRDSERTFSNSTVNLAQLLREEKISEAVAQVAFKALQHSAAAADLVLANTDLFNVANGGGQATSRDSTPGVKGGAGAKGGSMLVELKSPPSEGGGASRSDLSDELPLATGIDNLDFLSGAHETDEPLPILTHPKLPELIEQFKQHYAFIVIEVAGVLEYPDAVHIGRLTDAAVLSVLRNESVAGGVGQAYDRLAQSGRPVFGTLLA